MNSLSLSTIRSDLLSITDAALKSMSGEKLVANHLKREKNMEPLNVLAIGKAAASMAKGVRGIPRRALIITKYNHSHPSPLKKWRNLKIIESGHPLPDRNSLKAGQAIKKFCSSVGEEPVLCLLSGGASALTELPKEPHTFTEIQDLTRQLLASKVPIEVINAKRKKMSQLKGGGLARMLHKNQILALYLSDITNNDLSFIVSGLLIDADNPHPFLRNHILADNRLIVAQAVSFAADKYKPVSHKRFLTDTVEKTAAEFYDFCRLQPGKLHIAGGEPLVELPAGAGKGGRNQHLALLMAEKLAGERTGCFLSVGTDGTDGITEYAGGIVTNKTCAQFMQKGLDYGRFIKKADSANALKLVDSIINTGPTETNLMDMMIGYIAPK